MLKTCGVAPGDTAVEVLCGPKDFAIVVVSTSVVRGGFGVSVLGARVLGASVLGALDNGLVVCTTKVVLGPPGVVALLS